MALDVLDLSVLIAIAAAMVGYFLKNKFFGHDEGGFLSREAAEEGSRDLVHTLQKNDKNAIVFYGSQTGTAEDYASKLSKELSSRFGLKTMVVDLADYDYDNFGDISSDVLCFFLLATYGEGEATDNAITFVEYLDNEAESLSSIKFTCFGLGNSTYEFYNAVGKKIDARLEELGAERFAQYGEGDDGKGTMDEDYLSWKDALFDSLKNNLDLEEHESVYQPGLELTENTSLSKSHPSVSNGEPNRAYVKDEGDFSKGPFDHTHPYLAPITVSEELFNSKDRSCIHAEFDLSGSNLRYSTGDHLAIWPSNSNENVSKFLEAFGLSEKSDTVFNLKSLDATISVPFHTPITYDAVARHHLEISGAVSRQFLLSIAGFAPDSTAKELAVAIGNNKEEFAKQIHKNHFNIADALLYISKGQPWTGVPFVFLIESIQHLQPRYYSISSSSLTEKTSVHVTAVVEAEKHGDQLVTGVVTNLLRNIQIEQNDSSEKPTVTYDLSGPRNKFSGFKVPVHVRRSTFKLPSNPSVPVLLIGPGTGVAPFRGFVRERIALQKNGNKIGTTLLFYGCRTEQEDFLYKNEWPEYSKALGSILQVFVAFSRQTPGKKVYVQDKLLENSSQINKLIEDGGFIYVCGDASKMARDVQSTLGKIIAKERGVDDERAAEIIRTYKVQNRYQEDVW